MSSPIAYIKALVAPLSTDPRHYQILILSSLLFYGMGWLSFDVSVGQVILILSTTLLVQFSCTQWCSLPKFDARSPLISGLSLCLLLRTNEPVLLVLGAAVAIASKFIFKWNNKHIFNPTNFGIIAVVALSGHAWVSPAQWGSHAIAAFFLACVGSLVIYRAERSDVTYTYLFAFAAIIFGRAFSLGDPLAIPLRQLQNGALLLFAFFMISDPKSTPDSRWGRILFAVLVAVGAAYVQFGLYRNNGLLWSLVACSLLTPMIDRLLPGKKYLWPNLDLKSSKGEFHETIVTRARDRAHAATASSAGA